MVAVNMVAKSGEDSFVGGYINVSINHVFNLTLNINEVKEPRLGTELEDDTQTGMFDRLVISKGREKTCFLDIILPQNRQYLPLQEMGRGWFIWLSHDAKIHGYPANDLDFLYSCDFC
jgi:hypothetical protein